jgi:hypothetical protein
MAVLIKLRDLVFNGKHPNGINKGYTKTIEARASVPVVGKSYQFGSLRTSRVVSIIYEDAHLITFKTKNSTYQIQPDGK